MDTKGRKAQMESWDTTEVFNFLTDHSISAEYANILKESQLNGKYLSTFTLSDFKELETTIPLIELINIRNTRDEYFRGGLVIKNNERQLPRKFRKPVSSDLKYKLGSILPAENTKYSNEEPIREFKEFSLDMVHSMPSEPKSNSPHISMKHGGLVYVDKKSNL